MLSFIIIGLVIFMFFASFLYFSYLHVNYDLKNYQIILHNLNFMELNNHHP